MTCVYLNVIGSLLEISGFALVAYELFRTQRREFGDPWAFSLLQSVITRLERFIRRLFRRPKDVRVTVEAASSYAIGGKVKTKIRRGRGKTLEDHLAAVEKNFAELDREVGEHRAELDQAIGKIGDELKETRTELEQRRKEREAEAKEFRRASVTLQWCGIGLFVAGVIFSSVANVISCS